MKHPYNGRRLCDCKLPEPLVAIVALPLNGIYPPLDATMQTKPEQMVRPLQQVTLRPDKLSTLGYLRLGETPNDEANCWIHPENVLIVEVLGKGVEYSGTWRCEPFELGPRDALLADAVEVKAA